MPILSAMKYFPPIICFGSSIGDIHFTNMFCLKASEKNKCLGKTYSGHISPVNQI